MPVDDRPAGWVSRLVGCAGHERARSSGAVVAGRPSGPAQPSYLEPTRGPGGLASRVPRRPAPDGEGLRYLVDRAAGDGRLNHAWRSRRPRAGDGPWSGKSPIPRGGRREAALGIRR